MTTSSVQAYQLLKERAAEDDVTLSEISARIVAVAAQR